MLAVMAASPAAMAQMPIRLRVCTPSAPDSADAARHERRHFWRAAAETAGMDAGLWVWDRWVVYGDYAYISPRTMWANLRHGFYWDNDRLGTNMFLHPYNGSLFYNAGRSNGFNYWQSGLFALGGSAVWELFMEREYPSTNDIIATPIGGMAIGEVCYRVSDVILDDRTTGWGRAGREIAAAVVSPMRGLTRVLTGDAWRRRPTTGRRFGTPDVGVETGAGVRLISFHNNHRHDTRAGVTVNVSVSYGNPYDDPGRPYDCFSFHAELCKVGKQPLLSRLNISGRLLGRELRDDGRTLVSVGMFQHFDYYDSDTLSPGTAKCPYKLGVPACVGAGLLGRRYLTPRMRLDCHAHLNAVLLGGVLSDYYMVDERNYNLAMGYSVKAGCSFVMGDRLSATLTQELYRLFTFRGYADGTNLRTVYPRTLNAMGDKSTATFGVTRIDLEGKVWRRLYVGVSVSHTFRASHYHDPGLANVRSASLDQSMTLKWKF